MFRRDAGGGMPSLLFNGGSTPVLPVEAALPYSLRPKATSNSKTAGPTFIDLQTRHLGPFNEGFLRIALTASLSIADARRTFLFNLQDWRERVRRLMPFSDVERMDAVLKSIADDQAEYIELLKQAVSYPSISAMPKQHLKDILNAVDFFKDLLHDQLGFSVELRHMSDVVVTSEGENFTVPPLILASMPHEASHKKTLLIYGHIDVMPAKRGDGWNTDPFDLTNCGNQLCGRGVVDDKGPVIAWLTAVSAFRKCQVELPVNVRIVLEGMEETGSVGMGDELRRMKAENHPFVQHVDHLALCDTCWLAEHPCVSYGVRGVATYTISVECATTDLHSGVFGGFLNEGMSDLVYLLDKLVDVHGRLLIPGIYDDVRPITEEERHLYDNIQYTPADRAILSGIRHTLNEENAKSNLMAMWREPSLSIHGIEGAYSDSGCKTVIPARVLGKFSIRTVPNMDPIKTDKLVKQYLQKLREERGTKNDVQITAEHGSSWYEADPWNATYTAARLAGKRVYGVEPWLTREGCSIPVSNVLAEVVGRPICYIAIAKSSDGPHSAHEKIDVNNFIQGAQMMAAYFHELSLQ